MCARACVCGSMSKEEEEGLPFYISRVWALLHARKSMMWHVLHTIVMGASGGALPSYLLYSVAVSFPS